MDSHNHECTNIVQKIKKNIISFTKSQRDSTIMLNKTQIKRRQVSAKSLDNKPSLFYTFLFYLLKAKKKKKKNLHTIAWIPNKPNHYP